MGCRRCKHGSDRLSIRVAAPRSMASTWHVSTFLILQFAASAATTCTTGEYGFNGTCVDCGDTNPWGDEAVGTDCSQPGVELDNLPVKPGYFRQSRRSRVVRECQNHHNKPCFRSCWHMGGLPVWSSDGGR